MEAALETELSLHDNTAQKAFVQANITCIADVKLELVKAGEKVGVFHDQNPGVFSDTVRPVFKCMLPASQAKDFGKPYVWVDAQQLTYDLGNE